LGPEFRQVASIYQPLDTSGGQYISELLQGDWQIFSRRIENAPDGRMHELAVSILEAGLHPKHDVDEPEYSGFFERGEPTVEAEWHEQVEEILSGVRLPTADMESPFPDQFGLPSRVEATLLELGESHPAEAKFFRARIYRDLVRTQPFELSELGAPPPEKVPAQRANRKGEPVLYLATNEKTALAEVRAWKGANVAIGTFELARKVEVLNLTKVPVISTPFFEEDLAWKLNAKALLSRFAEELSRPVIRGREEEEEFQYKPSQHACEAIRGAGYDGIVYPSAMGSGHNLVFFDQRVARPIRSINVLVTSVSYRGRGIPPGARISHNWPYDAVPKRGRKGVAHY
jgi:RES domain-containing protein